MSDNILIRRMTEDDKEAVLTMMRVFYDSPAVLHTSSDRVLENDFEACVGVSPYLDGYIFDAAGVVAGYSMVARSYTTEYGGLCGWIEDLYIRPEYRGRGVAGQFFRALPGMYPEVVRFKLEVEPENEHAVEVYKSCGYSYLPYNIMEQVVKED